MASKRVAYVLMNKDQCWGNGLYCTLFAKTSIYNCQCCGVKAPIGKPTGECAVCMFQRLESATPGDGCQCTNDPNAPVANGGNRQLILETRAAQWRARITHNFAGVYIELPQAVSGPIRAAWDQQEAELRASSAQQHPSSWWWPSSTQQHPSSPCHWCHLPVKLLCRPAAPQQRLPHPSSTPAAPPAVPLSPSSTPQYPMPCHQSCSLCQYLNLVHPLLQYRRRRQAWGQMISVHSAAAAGISVCAMSFRIPSVSPPGWLQC